ARLEPDQKAGRTGDVADAAARTDSRDACGLLWHALGHVRERRGLVKVSGLYFEMAEGLLNPERNAFELAECLIGRSRIVFQNRSKYSDAERSSARARVNEARALLAPLPDPEAR